MAGTGAGEGAGTVWGSLRPRRNVRFSGARSGSESGAFITSGAEAVRGLSGCAASSSGSTELLETPVITRPYADGSPRGATLYVTLEPCSTQGRTPPCTDLILRSGIARVVVGCTDPNPRHAGRGFDLLRRADDLADRYDARPNRLIAAYPVVSLVQHNRNLAPNLLGETFTEADRERVSSELHVTAEHPPTFLFHTTDDPVVPAQQSIDYAQALMAAGVSVELHLYASGPHGVGLAQHRPTLRSWPALTVDWLAGLEG